MIRRGRQRKTHYVLSQFREKLFENCSRMMIKYEYNDGAQKLEILKIELGTNSC